jgi:hypothetical protein
MQKIVLKNTLLAESNLTLIPTSVTTYGSHYLKTKFLKKSLSKINSKKLLILQHFI